MVNGSRTAAIVQPYNEHGGGVRLTVTIDLVWVVALSLILLSIKLVVHNRQELAAAGWRIS